MHGKVTKKRKRKKLFISGNKIFIFTVQTLLNHKKPQKKGFK